MTQQFSVDEPDNVPSSQLDIYNTAIEATVNDELLQEINLGLGNYSDAEYWQQVESFQQGMYADEAFARRLNERVIDETKRKLALEGWTYFDEKDRDEVVKDKSGWEDLDEDERAERSRRQYIDDRGEEIWGGLTEDTKMQAVSEKTGVTGDWIPPHWRMMMMRHEASRSKDARLLDNLFQRVKEFKGDDSNKAKGRLQR